MTNDLNDERFERLECLAFKYFKKQINILKMNNKRKLLILPILIIFSIVSCKQKEESQVETENATILESSVQLSDAQ